MLDAEMVFSRLPKAAAALIVTNTTVAPLYAQILQRALAGKYAQVHAVVLPDGEEHKTWQTLNLILMPCSKMGAIEKRCCSPWAVAWWAT